MKESQRTRRMERHHKRRKQQSSLNMVSMMDIFTILVFFLLFSSGKQQNLPALKDIKLPESQSRQTPNENLVILVSENRIQFQGKTIASSQQVMANNSAIIPNLINALNVAAKRMGKVADEKTVHQRGVTIMGDKKIPYDLLKKIMMSCASSNFTNISLAVVQKSSEKN